MIEPVYQREGVTLYHGDCLAILPQLEAGSVDAVVTDPPYGINAARDRNSQEWGWKDYDAPGWDTKRPEREAFDAIRRLAKTVVVWGGNYFTDYLPPTSCWLVWDKGQRNFSLADCELAWCSVKQACRVITYHRALAMRDGKVHATQKPVAVMEWTLDKAKVADTATVLDPFMGSGTTGVACIRTGRRFIGIELERKYVDIAIGRIEKAFSDRAEMLPMGGVA